MKKYRLKKEARQFFDEKYHTEAQEVKWWKSNEIPIQLLEEVERVYVVYGHEKPLLGSGTRSWSLNGWSGEAKEAEIRFAIKIADIDHSDYESLEIEKIMDEIQKVLNSHLQYLDNF